MSKTLKDLLILTICTLFLTLIIWLPHLLKVDSFYGLNFSRGFSTIYQNFDGLEYVVIAKTFYSPDLLAQIPQNLPATYFPSHFPGYPALIAVFAPIFGYLKSMLFVSVLFTALGAIVFYFLVKDFKLSTSPLWLSIVFLFLPARWLTVHSVGSPEPLFIFLVIVTIYFFKKHEDYSQSKFLWLSAIFASLAQSVRPPGLLLFVAIFIYLFWKTLKQKGIGRVFALPLQYLPFLLVPITLLGIFMLYQIQLGDFWAYFHSGDNIHLTFPPFQVFNKYQFWVGDIWLEDIVYIFILGFLGGLLLLKSSLPLSAFFVLIYLTATTLVAHRDIARYSLPIAPFLIIAFERVIGSKEFKIVAAIAVLAIYLYSQNFLIENVAPIANLSDYN